MKTKHNKKRNTAFIFEALIREVSKSIIDKNSNRKNKTLSIMKEYFSKGSVLSREVECYKALQEQDDVDLYTGEKLIHRAKQLHESLDKQEIFSEQTSLINKINKDLGSNVFLNFVPNYRDLATIAQIFNDKTPVKQKVLMERQILKNLSKDTETEESVVKPIDSLVVKSFTERYNQEYSGLLPEQKELLSKYILSFGDNEVDFKLYFVNEIKRIKKEIEQSKNLPEISSDEIMLENTRLVLTEIDKLNVTNITEKHIKKVMKLQILVNEYKSDASED